MRGGGDEEETAAEEPAAEEPAAEEPAAEEPAESVSKTLDLKITKEEVGRFLGKGGMNLKRHILSKTHKEVDGENNRIYCSIETEGNVFKQFLRHQMIL